MEEKRGRRSFDRDYKFEVVRQVTEGGRSITDVASSIDVHANTIYN